MRNELCLNENATLIQADPTQLTVMIATFVDGLNHTPIDPIEPSVPCPPVYSEKRHNKIFRLPLPSDETRRFPDQRKIDPIVAKNQIGQLRPMLDPRQKNREKAHYLAMKGLIDGVSIHFNDILMGIWGNLTLMRLSLGKTEQKTTVVRTLAEMEQLIQNGAFLLHMVFGYLLERRLETRQCRLHQIMQQIHEHNPAKTLSNEPWQLEERLIQAVDRQSPLLIAGSSAHVLDVLFQKIDGLRDQLAKSRVFQNEALRKLTVIAELVSRGLETTRKLQWYAGDCQPHKSRGKLYKILEQMMVRLHIERPRIEISFTIGGDLPNLTMDPSRIEWVVRELCNNAITAGSVNLKIDVRRLSEQPPEDRCVVHALKDYEVITIQDCGKGMSRDIQRRIFEPFFGSAREKHKKGLGLSAAAGIIKAHGGYIQVQSKNRVGTVFKIYLPISQRDLKRYKVSKTVVSTVPAR